MDRKPEFEGGGYRGQLELVKWDMLASGLDDIKSIILFPHFPT